MPCESFFKVFKLFAGCGVQESGDDFLTNFGGPKCFSVGLEVIESSVSRMLS